MKTMRVIIFIMIGLLLLGCIGIGAIYFTTDIFKSNEDMFYKYLSQEDILDFLNIKSMNEFTDKLKTTPNEQNGKITIATSQNTEEFLTNSNIIFNNKLDNKNNLFQSEVVFENSNDEELFKFKIVRNNDIYGIMIDKVINKYMAIENNNLKSFAEKFEITQDVPDKIEIENYIDQSNDFEEKLKKELSEIFNSIKSQASKENYSKIEKTTIDINGKQEEVVGYKLILNNKELNKIIEGITENDLQILNTFLQDDSFGANIIIYVKDKKLVKINILMNNEEDMNISISKTIALDSDIWDLEVTKEDIKSVVKFIKTGSIENNDIKYILTSSISSTSLDTSSETNIEIDVNFEFNINFTPDFEIIELNNENSVLINNANKENLVQTLKFIGEKIYNETGFKDTILGTVYKTVLSLKTTENQSITSMETNEKQLFNSRFKQYEGQINGTGVNTLLSVIKTSNQIEDNIVKVLYNNSDEPFEIDNMSTYNISFEYNNEGYISTIKIDE